MSAGRVRQGGVFVEIGADPRPFFNALNRVNRRASQFGARISNLGAKISAAAIGFGVPIGMAVSRFKEFDDAIRAVAAVTGSFGPKGAAAFKMLNDGARELGRTTSFTAVQVANLMTELGRAGFDASQIDAMTGSVLNLARATQTEASSAAGIMANAIRQFSLEASDASRVADTLTTAANSSFTTAEQLGEALSYVGLTASQAGLSLEETVAIVGTLGNLGIQGSRAGRMLQRMLAITGSEADALKEKFGVDFLDDKGDVRSIIEIFRDLGKATNDLPSGERIKKFNEAFGLLGLTGAQALGGNIGSVDELIAKLESGEGSARKMAEQMDSGLGGSMRKMMSAVEGVALSFAESLAPGLKIVADKFTQLMGAVTQFISDNSELVATVVFAGAQVAIFGAGLVALGTAIQLASFAAGGLLAGLAMLASPLGIIAALAVAFSDDISLAFEYVTSQSGAVSESFAAIADTMTRVFGGMMETASSTMTGVFDAIANGDLQAATNIAWLGVKAIWLEGQAAIMNAIDPWLAYISNGFTIMGTEIAVAWDSTWSFLQQSFNTAGAFMVGFFDNVINGIAAAWDFLEGSIRKAWISITGMISGSETIEADVKAVDAEMKERSNRRAESRPGIEKRVSKAKEENARVAKDTDERIKGMRKQSEETQAERTGAVEGRRVGRAFEVSAAKTEQKQAAGDQAKKKSDRSLADVLIDQLANTSDMDEFNTLIKEIERLVASGNLTESQKEEFGKAVGSGADNIAKDQMSDDKKSEESAAAASRDIAQTKTETAGTFSAAQSSQLGFDTNIAQRTLKAAEKTAENTGNLATGGAGTVSV